MAEPQPTRKNFTQMAISTPPNGEDIYGTLLELIQGSPLQEQLNAETDQTSKNQLFQFFLHEVAHELAAATYTSGVTGNATIDRLSFDDLARAFLKSKGLEDFAAIDALPAADKLKLYKEFTAQVKTVHPRVLEQTPHPTEPLDTAAINSYMALRDFARTQARALFENPNFNLKNSNLPLDGLLQKITAFYDTLEPPETGLTAENEQARSAVLSKQIYDSVPALASNLIKTRDRFGLHGIEDEAMRDTIRQEMRNAALDAGKYMVRNYTWSPMDMDGKLQMDRRKASEGLRGKKLAINQQYIEDLANLAVRLQNHAAESGREEPYEEVERIQAIIWRLFGNIEKIYPTKTNEETGWPRKAQVYFDKIDNFLQDIPSRNDEQAVEFIRDIWKRRHNYKDETRQLLNIIKYTERSIYGETRLRKPNKESIANLEQNMLAATAELGQLHQGSFVEKYLQKPSGLITPEQTLEELAEIAELPGVREVCYRNSAGRDDILSEIDAIGLKIATYRNSAQKITWRQSSGVHKTVMGEVLKLFEGKESVLNRKQKDFGFMQRIEELQQQGLFTLNYSTEEAMDVRDLIRILKSDQPEVKALGDDIRSTVRYQVNLGKDKIYQKKDVLADPNMTKEQRKEYFDKHAVEIYTYETLDVADFINHRGRDFGHILTAETNTPEPLWNVFAEQLVMQDPEEKEPDPAEQPQIIALTEYLDDIINLPHNISQAMAFEPFRKEMEARAEKSPPWLQVWDDEKGSLREMTVKDLLEQIKQGEPDAAIAQQRYDEMLDVIKRRIYLKNKHGDALSDAEIGPEEINAVTSAQLQQVSDEEVSDALNQKVLSYVAMVAGSDSFKSAGAAIEYTIARRFQDAQKQLMAYDTLLNFYMGNGSAMHRVGITSALIRTHQGRQMKEGVETITAESENVIVKRAAEKHGYHQMELGSPQSDEERFVVSLHNIGNRCNLQLRMNEEEREAYDISCYESEAFYSSLYKDYDKGNAQRPDAIIKAREEVKDRLPQGLTPEDFGNYMQDIALTPLDAVSKNGARFSFRPGAEPDAYVDSMRAIGYGASHGYTGFGQPHLTFALSHMLGNEGEKSFERYINNPYLQGRVNRAVKDLLVEFKPEIGWQNVSAGCGLNDIVYGRAVAEPYGVTIHLGKQKFSLDQLVEGGDELTAKLKQAITQDSPEVERSDEDVTRIIKNIRMAAVVEQQGRQAIESTTRLFKEYEKRAKEQNPRTRQFDGINQSGQLDSPTVLLQYYQAISPAKGKEMAFLREQYQHCLGNASEYFRSFKQDGKLPKKTGKDEVEAYQHYRKAYYDIATMKTILETALSSDKSPAYAVAIANDHVKQSQQIR